MQVNAAHTTCTNPRLPPPLLLLCLSLWFYSSLSLFHGIIDFSPALAIMKAACGSTTKNPCSPALSTNLSRQHRDHADIVYSTNISPRNHTLDPQLPLYIWSALPTISNPCKQHLDARKYQLPLAVSSHGSIGLDCEWASPVIRQLNPQAYLQRIRGQRECSGRVCDARRNISFLVAPYVKTPSNSLYLPNSQKGSQGQWRLSTIKPNVLHLHRRSPSGGRVIWFARNSMPTPTENPRRIHTREHQIQACVEIFPELQAFEIHWSLLVADALEDNQIHAHLAGRDDLIELKFTVSIEHEKIKEVFDLHNPFKDSGLSISNYHQEQSQNLLEQYNSQHKPSI